MEVCGRERESHGRDLFEAIERGDYPKMDNVCSDNDRRTSQKSLRKSFDITKIWRKKEFH
jgi:catalase